MTQHTLILANEPQLIITATAVQALMLVEIRVPDHLIVGGRQIFSFAEHGLL